jgi:cytochrome c-type biogenesis protein CcmH
MAIKSLANCSVLLVTTLILPLDCLSQKVLAVVRLSKSGSAMRQASDIEAVSQVIDVRDNPTVELKL